MKTMTCGLLMSYLALGLLCFIPGMNRAEAAIAFRAATSVDTQTSVSSCTMSKPTGTIKDDVMIAAFQFAQGSSVTPPTGWNVIVRTDDTTNSMSVISYYKVAGASEPASYTWTLAPTSGWCTGGIHSYVGVSTSTPVDVSGGQSGTSNSPTTPSLTTTADSDWLIGVWAVWNGNVTMNLPAGMTSRINFTGGSPHRQADQSLGAAGTTGTSVTTTSTPAGSWIAQAIMMKSAAASPDTTPPVIASITTTATTASGTTMTWTTNEPADAQGEYGLTTSYGASTPLDTALVTAHAQTLSGLTASTVYHYRVKSRDAAGNIATSGDNTFLTAARTDTTPPTVALTSPAASATVSGTITVSATASDNIGVVGVQFLLDGATLGAEDLSAPYAVSWDTSSTLDGVHTVTARARDATGNTATATGVAVTVSNTTDAAQIGQWAAPFSWPIVAVNAVLMHTGKVLAFDDSGTGAQVWDPGANSFTPVPNNVTDLFCAGHAALPDGRILVPGGHTPSTIGTNEANIFDPLTQTWIALPKMAYRRWYPTVTALPDGRMLVTAGDQTNDTDFAPFPEVYDPATNRWTTLTTANLPLPTYPHMFVLPSGKLVNTGTTEAAIPTRTLDVTTQTWSMVDARVFDGASSVMYRPGLILKVGTASDSGFVGPAAATTYLLDMNQPTPAWQQTASMHYPRATTTTLVVVPDGNVMVFGGGTNTSGYDATSQPIYTAEQWSPVTQTWRVMASQSKPRLYHAVALLLPDGRVLSAGSGRDAGVTDQRNGEMYSPPYLFQGARPTITSVPTGAIAYGSSFFVGTPAPDIASIALIRPAAVTHGFDEDQRFVNLSFAPTTGGLTVQAPANANLAPPGYYMLFLLNSHGVPSVAHFLRLPSSVDDTQPPTAPTNLTATGAIGAVTLSWTAATDNVGVTGYTLYRSTVSGFTPSVANQVGQAPSTTYTDAVPAGIYYYRVEANDAAGNFSAASNEASGTATADTTSPTVTIPTPTTGSTVSGTITVVANATDNVVVAGVQFFLDGMALGAEVTNSPYVLSWSTATATNGPHTLAATARDAAGNTATSSPVRVTVNNTQPAGLVGGFSFNEGAGPTVADASGGGNIGTIVGATWTTAGKFGNALSFNGINSYVELAKTDAYDSLTQGTIEAWVQWSGPGYASWFSADSGNCLNPFEMAVDNGKFEVWAGSSGCGATLNAYVAIPNPTAWHHLAYVVSSVGNTFYIDGVAQTATYVTGSAASTFFFHTAAGGVTHYNIGRSVNNNSETFPGTIDELRIYNRALTPTEIQNDMHTPM